MKFLPRIFTRWTFWATVAGVLIVYTVVGFWLVPRIVRSQLISGIAELYDRQATVGKARFNPYTFVLEVEDFALPDTDGRPMLGFKRLHVDFELMSILRRAYSFRAIALDQPTMLAVVRADSSLNLADLAKPEQPAEPVAEASEPAEATEVPRLFIEAFTVDTGRIDFEDHSRESEFRSALKPITFALRDFSTLGTGANAYTLDAESTRGERLAWRGTLNANPVSSQGAFTLTNVQARTLWDYIRDSVGFEIPSGTLDLKGNYTFSLAREPVDLEVVAEEISVHGLVVRPQVYTTDDVKLDELVIREARANVADRRASVASITLKGGRIQAWLESDGTLSLARLQGKADEPASVPATSENEAPASTTASAAAATPPAAENAGDANRTDWVVSLPLVETSGLEVAFEDRSVKPAVSVKLAPIDFKLTDYESTLARPVGVEAHIGIDETGSLSTRGSVDLNTYATTLDLELKDLDLRGFQPYIARVSDLALTSGKAGVKGKLELNPAPPDDALKTKFAGTLDVTKFRTIDNALEEDFVRWDALRALGIDYDEARSRLVIKEIAARRPYARVIIASDGTVNVSEVLKPQRPEAQAPQSDAERAAAAKPAPAAKEKPLDVRIGLVRVDKASANFADYSLAPFPNFATGIQELSGTVAGLSSRPDSRAKVKLDGKVDAYAPVTIEGEINYLSAETFTNLKLAFDNMELTTFTPYSGKFAGYRIEKGKLSVVFVYQVENRQLNAQHKVILNQLQLGERVESAEATTLPVKLAVALLRDRNGVIDLDLPVTGSLDDPKFRLGPLIWKVVTNVVTKIVTAPFALLGKLFGGGEEVNQLTFAAGGAELQGESRTRIDSVSKALKERPGLELEIPMAVNPELDRPVLQRSALDERLIAIKRHELLAKRKSVDTLDATVLADRNEYYRLLNELALQEQVITEDVAKENRKKVSKAEDIEMEITPLEDLVLAKLEVPDTGLSELGRRRAQVVQDLLLASGEIEPARVFVVTADAAPNEGSLVRMDLSLR